MALLVQIMQFNGFQCHVMLLTWMELRSCRHSGLLCKGIYCWWLFGSFNNLVIFILRSKNKECTRTLFWAGVRCHWCCKGLWVATGFVKTLLCRNTGMVFKVSYSWCRGKYIFLESKYKWSRILKYLLRNISAHSPNSVDRQCIREGSETTHICLNSSQKLQISSFL